MFEVNYQQFTLLTSVLYMKLSTKVIYILKLTCASGKITKI